MQTFPRLITVLAAHDHARHRFSAAFHLMDDPVAAAARGRLRKSVARNRPRLRRRRLVGSDCSMSDSASKREKRGSGERKSCF
jgi:hypothetical protein